MCDGMRRPGNLGDEGQGLKRAVQDGELWRSVAGGRGTRGREAGVGIGIGTATRTAIAIAM